jgi:hypothetical protein
MRFDGTYVYVDARTAGTESTEEFMVDTGDAGFGSGGLRAGLFERLTENGQIRQVQRGRHGTISGVAPELRGRLGAITLADHRLENLLFSKSECNILGLNYWSRFVTTFDFPGGAIYLRKGQRFELADLADNSGLGILRSHDHTIVKMVDEKSPAASAGARAGDILLKIDGKNVDQMRLSAVRRCLCAQGKEVHLMVRREDDLRELALSLPVRPLEAPGGH